ncbi:hypothetical protein AB6A40_008916 [Gnathostoma spinigerum]|uniref:Uncharacterized protein n=1 Tax=Gnathostoma spinigerum TaxID=75299 RepID=A0ABD6EZR8_9BILA
MASARRGCPIAILLRFLFEITITTASNSLHSISTLKLNPEYVHDLVAGENVTVAMTLNVNSTITSFEKFKKEQPWKILLRSLREDVVTVHDAEREIQLSDFTPNLNGTHTYKMNFTLCGRFLGKTAVKIRLLTAVENEEEKSFVETKNNKEEEPIRRGDHWIMDVWVRQKSDRLLNRLFLITLITLITIANVLMGCELDLSVIFETLKRPLAPVVGLFCQFVLMPLLSFGIANLVFLSRGLHSFALGLFVTGCAPGGGASNYWTLLLDGNLPVSVTMTFVSTVSALAMMPLWMWALGDNFLHGYHPDAVLKVPYTKIFTSLIVLIVPLLIGIGISRWKPAARQKARKVMRPFIIFVLVFVVCFGIAANMYMIQIITWTALIGGLLLPWCGFMFGCFFAIAFRQSPSTVTAIAIETGIQNTGIAIMLLKVSNHSVAISCLHSTGLLFFHLHALHDFRIDCLSSSESNDEDGGESGIR